MLKLATIGTSQITDRFLRAAAVTEGLQPYAAFSRDLKKAREFGEPRGAAVFYDDYAKMLADPAVDIVYIGSPNGLHFGQMEQAIEAGKAVICEKAFVSNMAEFELIEEKILKKRAFVFEAITTASMPNFARLRDCLAEIGPVHLAKIDFSQFSSRFPQLKAGERTNIFDPAFSGGALYDIGVYCLHLAVGLFGMPERLSCFCSNRTYGIDTSGIVMLQYPELTCSLTFSKDTQSARLTELQGEKGWITLEGSTGKLDKMTLCRDGEAPRNISLPQHANPMVYEAAAFVKAVVQNDFDYVLRALNQTRQVMELLCRARAEAGIVFAADEKTV